MLKSIKTLSIAFIFLLIFSIVAFHFWLSPRYAVPILMYHRVGNEKGDPLSVSPDSFQRQMGYIKYRGYNVISLDELVKGIKNNKKFKRHTAVITFDDGYEDNYKFAYPALKGYGFPATIFLISNYIDSKEGFLRWQQIKEMLANSKITVGGHTENNVYLPGEKSKSSLIEEIAGCKNDIEANTGRKVDYFCYPTGGFTEEIKQIVKEAGYKGACTTNRGFVKFNKDAYELKRIKIKDTDFTKNPVSFWVKLSGYYNLFRRGKRPY